MFKIFILILFLIQNVLIGINCERAHLKQEDYDLQSREWYKPERPPPIDCDNQIYCKCHIQRHFNEQQLENVKNYFQYRWYYEASAKPLRKPCKQIYVRKNWKCLSDVEKIKFVRAFRILYETGVMNALGEYHQKWWAATHKTNEFWPFHVTVNLILERELWKIDPTLPGLPYWDFKTEFAEPHKSCIWKEHGWGGLYRNGYCVRNGAIFGDNLQIDFQPRCLKRQWSKDGTVPPVFSAELETSWIQAFQTYDSLSISFDGFHFIIHLSCGGWDGDFAQTIAANDIAFHMTHNDWDRIMLLWQLQNATKLTPVGPSAAETFQVIDYFSGELKFSTPYDKLTYVNKSRLEYFQHGYGDLCYVYDSMVDPIDRIVRGEPPLPPPNSVNRLIKSLSPEMLQKYYPLFAEGRTDYTTHVFDYLPECNTKCKPMPFFQRYNDTGYGRRQNLILRVAGEIDSYDGAQTFQHYWWDLMMNLNRARYCSPAVNT